MLIPILPFMMEVQRTHRSRISDPVIARGRKKCLEYRNIGA
jgi:hypothetical protein